MPFALLIVGTVLLVSAVKNTQDDLFTLLQGDFTGPNNFIYWMAAILLIGAVGYIPKLKPISTGFLVLVVVVLVLKRGDPNGVGGGLFTQLSKGLGSTTTQPTTLNKQTQLGGSTLTPGSEQFDISQLPGVIIN